MAAAPRRPWKAPSALPPWQGQWPGRTRSKPACTGAESRRLKCRAVSTRGQRWPRRRQRCQRLSFLCGKSQHHRAPGPALAAAGASSRASGSHFSSPRPVEPRRPLVFQRMPSSSRTGYSARWPHWQRRASASSFRCMACISTMRARRSSTCARASRSAGPLCARSGRPAVQPAMRSNFTRRSSCALIATMMVLTDISTAPTAGASTSPKGANTPAASGMAAML